MGANFGKVFAGVSALAGIVPGGQALAGVAGVVAKAVATEEGVRYLSPYLDATIPAPFGFPSAPAALTPKPSAEPQAIGGVLGFTKGAAAASGTSRPLFRLKGSERAPYLPADPKPNLAGLIRAPSAALAAHPQFMGGQAYKWTTESGWVERVARLRVGFQLEAEGLDPSWAFYDDPPTSRPPGLDKFAAFKGGTGPYLTPADFQPIVKLSGAFAGFAQPAPANLQGVPLDSLATRCEVWASHARDLVALEVERVWDEIRAQQAANDQLSALAAAYKAQTEYATAHGLPMLPFDVFIGTQTLAQTQPAQVAASEVVTPTPARRDSPGLLAAGIAAGFALLWLV